MEFTIGARVRIQGYRWKDEPYRYGRVVELFHGRSNGLGEGAPLMSICWDDTNQVSRGFLRVGGRAELVPLVTA